MYFPPPRLLRSVSMSLVCAKPGCVELIAGWFATNRDSRSVTISVHVAPHATGLCSSHLQRFSVPAGWSLIDERDDDPAANEDHVVKRPPWFAPDTDPESVEPLEAAEGTMLSRAFTGPTKSAGRPTNAVGSRDDMISLESRRLARLERIHGEVNGGPERSRRGQKQQGKEHRNGQTGDYHRNDLNVGPSQNRTDDEDDRQQGKTHDRVDSYGTDELPFPPLEAELAPRAALG